MQLRNAQKLFLLAPLLWLEEPSTSPIFIVRQVSQQQAHLRDNQPK